MKLTCNLRIEEGCVGLDGLTSEDTNGSKHAYTAMCQLSLAKSLDLHSVSNRQRFRTAGNLPRK